MLEAGPSQSARRHRKAREKILAGNSAIARYQNRSAGTVILASSIARARGSARGSEIILVPR